MVFVCQDYASVVIALNQHQGGPSLICAGWHAAAGRWLELELDEIRETSCCSPINACLAQHPAQS